MADREVLRPTTVDELVALVGCELGPTEWHTLTQQEIGTFAEVTGDHQWIHVDPERAAAGPFGATIGHGLFMLSLGPAFMEELMAFDGFAHSLNYGYNKVRFPHPCPVGSKVRMRVTVTDVTPAGVGSAQITTTQYFEADGIEKPVCVAESIGRFTEHGSRLSMTVRSTQVRLARRPQGFPDEHTWEVTETKVPTPEQGQFLVAVDHISLDPAMRRWLNDVRSYVPPVGIGEVMRAPATGTVTESRHPDYAVGDAVSGWFGVTEHALSDGTGVARIDTGLAGRPTWLGALGLPGMTAWFGLFDVGRLQDGETVVVSGAAGAVGSVAGQLAKARGCRVVGIAGGPEKCAWLREIGFDATIDYKADNPLKRLPEAVPEGIDVFFDNVGGDILDAGLANLRRGARVVICGAISGYNADKLPEGPRRYMSLVVLRASMTGFLVLDYEDRYPEAIEGISEMVRTGRLLARETVVSGGVRAFPEALLGLFRGINTGKLVLKV
jgi:NADPH-dependent curcumin reductase CurA/acyl dehydratase